MNIRILNNKKGFTLIELLVVILIMGIAIAAISSFLLSSNKFFILGNDQRDSQNDARLASEIIISEVRFATNVEIVSNSEAESTTGNAIYLTGSSLNIIKNGVLSQTISGNFDSLNFTKNADDILILDIISSYGNQNYPVTVDLKLPNFKLLETSISGNNDVAIKYSSTYTGDATVIPNDDYSLTYYGNGSTGGAVPSQQTYASGESVTISGNTGNLVRSGYNFNGWNTNANGSGTAYSVGSLLTMPSSDVNLYAQWVSNVTYTVKYYGNGSRGGTVPSEHDYPYGSIVTVSGNTGNLVKSGYIFDGWNTKSNGSGTSYQENDSFTMPASDVDLYAQWDETYTIEYDGNDETDGQAPVDGNYPAGSTVTIKSNTGFLEKTYYDFNGWNKEDDGSGTSYAAGANLIMPADDFTLYAKWKAILLPSIKSGTNKEKSVTINLGGAKFIDSDENYSNFKISLEDNGKSIKIEATPSNNNTYVFSIWDEYNHQFSISVLFKNNGYWSISSYT